MNLEDSSGCKGVWTLALKTESFSREVSPHGRVHRGMRGNRVGLRGLLLQIF